MAVPSSQAQIVVDQLIENHVLGILNYAPILPKTPKGVVVRNIDPLLALQSMTFYLRNTN